MESLSLEGKAIYETVSASNDKFKAEIHVLIVSMVNASVTSAVDLAVERAVDKAVAATVSMAERNMQVYVDGVEKDLHTAMGLASQNTDPEPPIRSPGESRRPAHRGTALHRLHGGWETGLNPMSLLRLEVSPRILLLLL
jgi:hypothetical protein